MTCSAALQPNGPVGAPMTDDATLAPLVERLAGETLMGLDRRAGGGNNRLYRAQTAARTLAVKWYGPGLDRLGREWAALSFLAGRVGAEAPTAVACDPDHSVGLYEWIEGTAVARAPEGRAATDIEALIGFGRRLKALAAEPAADRIGTAAEACLSARDLIAQVRTRLARLRAVPSPPELHTFIADGLAPTLDRADARLATIYERAGMDPAADIPAALRTLSPSDYGFHNALRRPDGSLVFLDFEYFGWDDPVKLTADLLWHPAFRLSPSEQAAWLSGLTNAFGDDASFQARLSGQMPLYGLRWCAILLNEYLPERWERRVFAGQEAGWEEAKARQMAKARQWLAEATRLVEAGPDHALSDLLPLFPGDWTV